ncbi:MAG: response regulator [Candidatus Gygaella obscura]|nr:response regulator [Candidatus Gygaella obscura]
MENQGKILVVDDEEVIRSLLKDALTDLGYEVTTCPNGQTGIKEGTTKSFDTIITDIRLPDIDGIQILGEVRKADPEAVVIVITGYPSFDSVRDALKLGAHDYLTKPFNIDEITFTIKKAVLFRQTLKRNKDLVEELERKNMLLEQQNAILEVRVKERTANLQKLYSDLRKTYIDTIKAFADALDAKDHYTRSHSENVTRIAVKIAEELGLSSNEVEDIREAAQLHDLGKIGIDDAILRKPGKLNDEEWEQVKSHSMKGAQILEPLGYLKNITEIIKQHHEKYDGTGYPVGLKGTEIKLGARIVSLADSFEAMTSERPYRKNPLKKDEAIKEVKINSGTQFDPMIVETFLKIVDKL